MTDWTPISPGDPSWVPAVVETANTSAAESAAAAAASEAVATAKATAAASSASDAQGYASNAATAVSDHAALTTTHGVDGDIVGTTDAQTLTNKTLTSPVITGVGTATARDEFVDVAGLQDGSYTWVDGGGTADAITATYAPALTALVDGQICHVRATAANTTTTPTFSPNGITAHTIVKSGGGALVAGDIAGDGHELILRYNLANTRWELLNPAISRDTFTPEQFGAPANGTDDDTTAIASASAAGVCQFTPGKTYRLSTYDFADNTHWRTDGDVTIKHTGTASVMVNINNKTGCRMTGNFLFDGDSSTATGGIIVQGGANGFVQRGVISFTAIDGASVQIDGASYRNNFDVVVPYSTGVGSTVFSAVALTPDSNNAALRPYENHFKLIASKNIDGGSGSGRTYVDGGDRNKAVVVTDNGTGGECVYFYNATGGWVGSSIKKGGNSAATTVAGGDSNAFELSDGCRIDSLYAEDCPGYGLSFDGNSAGNVKNCSVGNAVIIRPDEVGCYFTDQSEADNGPVNCRVENLYVEDPANSTVVSSNQACLAFGGAINCSVGAFRAKETRSSGQRASHAILELTSASTATEFNNRVDHYMSEGSFVTATCTLLSGMKSTAVSYNGVPTVQGYSPELVIQTLGNGGSGLLSFLGLDVGGAANNWQVGTGIDADSALQFRSVTGAVTALSMLKSGKVGVQTNNPQQALDVSGAIQFAPGASVAPSNNGSVVFQLTNNTTLTVKAKGSDGTIRSGTVTLA